MELQNSLLQGAAMRGHRLAQVNGAFVFYPVRRQIDDLQGLTLLQHFSQMVCAVTGHAVAAGQQKHSEVKKRRMKLGISLRCHQRRSR